MPKQEAGKVIFQAQGWFSCLATSVYIHTHTHGRSCWAQFDTKAATGAFLRLEAAKRQKKNERLIKKEGRTALLHLASSSPRGGAES